VSILCKREKAAATSTQQGILPWDYFRIIVSAGIICVLEEMSSILYPAIKRSTVREIDALGRIGADSGPAISYGSDNVDSVIGPVDLGGTRRCASWM
jgi:hypothetical protein